MRENEISGQIIDAAVKIHQKLGPGLLESIYEQVLRYELEKRGFTVARQLPVPVIYDNLQFKMGFRADLVVEDLVIIEVKSVEKLAPVHAKQLMTYLKLTDLQLGLLLNFNEAYMKYGIKRIVCGLPEDDSA